MPCLRNELCGCGVYVVQKRFAAVLLKGIIGFLQRGIGVGLLQNATDQDLCHVECPLLPPQRSSAYCSVKRNFVKHSGR